MSRNRKCVNGAQSKDITVIDATLEVFLLKINRVWFAVMTINMAEQSLPKVIIPERQIRHKIITKRRQYQFINRK